MKNRRQYRRQGSKTKWIDFEIAERRNIVISKMKAFFREEEGLTIVEYAVAAGLITATVAASFGLLGAAVELVITTVTGYI